MKRTRTKTTNSATLGKLRWWRSELIRLSKLEEPNAEDASKANLLRAALYEFGEVLTEEQQKRS